MPLPPMHFFFDVDNTSVDMVLQKSLQGQDSKAEFSPDLKKLLESVNNESALHGITLVTHQDTEAINIRISGMNGQLSNNQKQMVEINKTLAWNIGPLMGEPFATQTTVCLQSDIYPPQNEAEPHPVGSTATRLQAFFEGPDKDNLDKLDKLREDIGETNFNRAPCHHRNKALQIAWALNDLLQKNSPEGLHVLFFDDIYENVNRPYIPTKQWLLNEAESLTKYLTETITADPNDLQIKARRALYKNDLKIIEACLQNQAYVDSPRISFDSFHYVHPEVRRDRTSHASKDYPDMGMCKKMASFRHGEDQLSHTIHLEVKDILPALEKERPSTTVAPLKESYLPAIQKRAVIESTDDTSTIEKLNKLCTKYIAHCGTPTNKKKILVQQIQDCLKNDKLSPQSRLQEVSRILTIANKDLLKKHRSSLGSLIIQGFFFHLLTLTLYSRFNKGSSAFWKSHGQVFVEEVEAAMKRPTK